MFIFTRRPNSVSITFYTIFDRYSIYDLYEHSWLLTFQFVNTELSNFIMKTRQYKKRGK